MGFFAAFRTPKAYTGVVVRKAPHTSTDSEVGLDPNGAAVISYIDTDDIDVSLKTLQNVGATVVKEPTDVGGGLRVAQVEVGGNVLGLRQQPAQ